MAGAGITRFSPDDAQNFAKLMDTSKPEEDMELEELKERKVLRLLLKIKNGEPPARRTALRVLVEHVYAIFTNFSHRPVILGQRACSTIFFRF